MSRQSAGPPSGRQFAIASGDHHAVVAQVGATLRSYTVRGVPMVDGFEEDQRASDGRGQVLAPWPNRLAAGRYVFGGHDCQAALNEPGRGNAIHGLVRWLGWTPVSHTAAAVTLRCVLHPQPGYEWELELEVSYRLADDGLTVSTVAVNRAPDEAPLGVGFHPYLTVGTDSVDEVELGLAARSTVTVTDPDAEPPMTPVSGTPLDFSEPRPIGAARIDTAFADLARDDDGRAVATLRDPGTGRGVAVWVDEGYRYLMVYTGDEVGVVARRRRSVAVEPMTCPPNALRSGVDLVRLEPNESWQAQWGLRPT